MGALGLTSQGLTPLPEVENGQPWRAHWVGLETWAPAAGLAHARRGQPEGYVPILLAAAGLSEGNEGAGKPPSPGTCRDSCQLGAVCVGARLLVPALLAQGIAGPAQRTVVGALGLTLSSPTFNKQHSVWDPAGL